MLHAVPLLAATRATWPDILVFAASAAVILVGAIGVVTSRNPVHAALSLVMTLFGVAVLFIEQEADFLAAVQMTPPSSRWPASAPSPSSPPSSPWAASWPWWPLRTGSPAPSRWWGRFR